MNATKKKSFSDNIVKLLKQELVKENFSLNFEHNSQFLKQHPEEVLKYFHSSIWPCCNHFAYLVYRFAIAIYYTIWFIESIIRNYEYRAQNFVITNKNKTNLLLLHPWPFYMTSWSLTILLVHLWINAFIVLYFYSIDKKSCLYMFFSRLFGPFSCSRLTLHHNSFIKENVYESQSKKDVESNELKVLEASNRTKENMQVDQYLVEIAKKKIKKAKSKNIIVKENSETSEKTELTEIVQTKSSVKSSKTYCEYENNCKLPSSSISTDEEWKLWINSHVPLFILIMIKISWLLYNLIVTSAILVTIGYFTFVTIFELQVETTWLAEIGNLHRHGLNSIVALIDIVLLAYPVRLLHFIYPAIYGWVYAIVIFFYWLDNPKDNIIYEQIDYSKPFKVFGYYVLLTFLTILMQSLHFAAYNLKLYLCAKCVSIRNECLESS